MLIRPICFPLPDIPFKLLQLLHMYADGSQICYHLTSLYPHEHFYIDTPLINLANLSRGVIQLFLPQTPNASSYNTCSSIIEDYFFLIYFT